MWACAGEGWSGSALPVLWAPPATQSLSPSLDCPTHGIEHRQQPPLPAVQTAAAPRLWVTPPLPCCTDDDARHTGST